MMGIPIENNNNAWDPNCLPPTVSKAMKAAIDRGDVEAVEALIQHHGADVDMLDVNEESGSHHSILILAISMRQFAIAKLLIQKGASVDTVFLNYDNRNRCIYAITAVTTARMLYEVHLDSSIGEILHWVEEALKKCQGRAPKRVPPHSLPDDIPSQVVIDAINEGDLFSVQLLINHGMDINTIQKDETGNQVSILISAIAQWHTIIAKFLIDRGAKVGTVFQNYNEESNKVFEVSALSIANERHKESPKDGMKDLIHTIETNLRHSKGSAPDMVISSNIPAEMKQHSKITAWLHKPVPLIHVDASSERASRASDGTSDVEEIHSVSGEIVEVNGNAKKYTEDTDTPHTSSHIGKQKAFDSTDDQCRQTNVAKESKMCTIL